MILASVALVSLLAACGGSDGSDGKAGVDGAAGTNGTAGSAALVRRAAEPAGANCAAGGIRIESGQDTSGNGALENAEVQFTSYACNGVQGATGATGAAGINTLILTSPEPIGINCAAGGLKVQSGPDTSRDGTLQPAEVTATSYICRAPAAIAKTWGTPALIETENLGNANSPQIAFDARGDAISVWLQSDGVNNNVWANRYTAGVGWGTAVMIEASNTSSVQELQIAVDAGGNALAVWSQRDAVNFNILANRYTVGIGWGVAALIETNAGNAFRPQIAFDPSGNAIAVWHQPNGGASSIWANRFIASSGWGTAELIETDNAGAANSPRVAFDTNGNAMAVWSQSDGTRLNVWANRYTTGSGWGNAMVIESENLGDAAAPQIVFDSNGNANVVWQQSDGARTNIWANRYTAGSGWGRATLIETDNTGFAGGPQIAIDANGSAIVVWSQSDGTRSNIVANDYR